ncbi:DUF2752 domain-containing protein [Streptomyces hypolithicus]
MDAMPKPAPASPPPGPAPGAAVGRRPGPLARRLGAPALTLAGVVAAFAFVGAVDPNEPGHYPVCPLLQVTGLYCPGCGGLRSAHAVATGDLAGAFGANALAVVGYGIFAVLWTLWAVRASRGIPARITLRPGYWWGIGAVVAVFSVVRNLPFGSALAP